MEDHRNHLFKIGFINNLDKSYNKYFYMFKINSPDFLLPCINACLKITTKNFDNCTWIRWKLAFNSMSNKLCGKEINNMCKDLESSSSSIYLIRYRFFFYFLGQL